MKFKYVAFDNKRKIQKGVIDGANLKEATKLLIDDGLFVRKISPKGKDKIGFKGVSIGGVSLIEKSLFVKHLGVMIKSGIDLSEALEVISEQTSSPKFKRITRSILEQVQTGLSLAKSMEKYPKVFDPLIVNMISVGEDSGTLEESLEYLSSELEDRIELKRNVQAASFYPAIILSATGGLGLVLSYFVLPQLTKLFGSLSFELPLSTKILLWVADVMDKHGLFIILGFIGLIIFLRILIAQKFVKPYWHWLLIKLPIIGNIIINYNLVLINRTLGILLKSGLTIDQAMTITIATTSNYVYKKKLIIALPQIQKGTQFSDILSSFKQSKRKPLFPLIVIKMISVGERSGKLDESLTYLSDYFGKEVDNTTKNLTTVLEPILLLTVGLIVGFIAISVITPIYQVTSNFNQ